MHLTDTHAHLNDPAYRRDLSAVLERARAAGVTAVVCVGYDLASSRRAVALARKEAGIYAAVGIHPHDAAKVTPRCWEALELLLKEPGVVAVGETGLDFYRDLSPRPVQRAVFEGHLELAARFRLPVIVHDREAHAETLEVLKAFPYPEKVVMHCFSGGPELAAECTRLLHLCRRSGYFPQLSPPRRGGAGDTSRAPAPRNRLSLPRAPAVAGEEE